MTLSDNAVEVLGTALTDLDAGLAVILPEDAGELRRQIDHVAAHGGGFTQEMRVVRPDNGEVRWLEARAQALCNDAGQPITLAGITFDMTERKHMEEVLRESDRRKDEFLAMLGHELRNPLAPIRSATDLMLRTTPDGAPVRRAVEIIDRQVTQMARMVDDLLDLSRITHGRIDLQHTTVDLAAVVAAAVEAGAPAMLERGHRLIVDADEPQHVRGDAARLQQCVVNLLSNAAKYTDAGGEIRVTLAGEGGDAVIHFTDNGAGIPAEMLPAVFEPFVQSARTLDRAQGGLGIGLSVVRRLVEMHGGSVAARSAGAGRGASFEIRLPRAARDDAAQPPTRGNGSVARKVLVIDDKQDAAESMAMMLRLEGHDVRVGFGASDALEMTREWAPEVVLLDIGLPDMDGYEVARRLRADGASPGLQLVALTGYGQPEDVQRSTAAGFDDHLVKPVDLRALTQVLHGAAPAG